ncbi:MAG: septation ring formation regulator EzrA [Bacilli bacterium]|nr:septation ring formation regulator EzrA [Bacilli bacterium]
MESITLIFITLFIVASVLIVGILYLIQNVKNKKYKKRLEELEIEKNKIYSAPIASELAKIETFLNNEKLNNLYGDWKNRFENIKKHQIPKITDMILEADYSLSQLDYKSTVYKLAKLEMELYRVKTNSELLLNQIKEVTTSEERNRAIVTKLKATYRELYQKFTDTKSDYKETSKPITLQFENIAKRFEDFELIMENNEYTEVTKIIKVIDEMLKHMEVVIEEMPSIMLMARDLLPKRIKEIEDIYKKMMKEGYPLDYLNVDYNIAEANKKINDILDRSKVLNLEDSLFELKVLMEYFDALYGDFEKEKLNKQHYEESNSLFKNKLDKTSKLVGDMVSKVDEIKNAYDLSDDDLSVLSDVKYELDKLENDYRILTNHTSNHTFAYSKLIKEVEGLVLRLANIEEKLDSSLDELGSMREDEVRARQQLDEVKLILKESKQKIREYNLPVIPKNYFVELNEASEAIKEIVKELNKKPITISVLNTRVDTARDLVLKLFTTTKEMMKTAMFAEMAIVYGNRYRSNVDELDKCLTYSEVLFYKGEYQKSLELTINSLNRIEPGIYNKLLKLYSDEK